MKPLQILILFSSFLVVICFIPLFLPSHASVSESIIIDAPPSVVYNLLDSISTRKQWTSFLSTDPTVEWYFPETRSSDTLIAWRSESSGAGFLSKENSIRDSLLHHTIVLGKGGVAYEKFFFHNKNGKTKLEWLIGVRFSYFDRYYGFGLGRLLKEKLREGLLNIQKLSES